MPTTSLAETASSVKILLPSARMIEIATAQEDKPVTAGPRELREKYGDWVTVKQLAAEAGIQPNTLWQYITNGYAPKAEHKIGNVHLYRPKTAAEWLTDRAKHRRDHPEMYAHRPSGHAVAIGSEEAHPVSAAPPAGQGPGAVPSQPESADRSI